MPNVFRAVASHHRALALLVATMGTAYMPALAKAQGLRGLFGDLARESAKIADDVPVRSIDDIVEEAGRSRAIRDTIEAEMRVALRRC